MQHLEKHKEPLKNKKCVLKVKTDKYVAQTVVENPFLWWTDFVKYAKAKLKFWISKLRCKKRRVGREV